MDFLAYSVTGVIMQINAVEVEVGNVYWFLEIDPESTAAFKYEYSNETIKFTQLDYELLKLCELRETSERVKFPFDFYRVTSEVAEKYKYWLNKVCYFYDVNNQCYDRDWVCLFGHVFKSKEDFLVHLVKTKLKIEHKPLYFLNTNKQIPIEFDDFLKEKMKESQKKNPHKWIF